MKRYILLGVTIEPPAGGPRVNSLTDNPPTGHSPSPGVTPSPWARQMRSRLRSDGGQFQICRHSTLGMVSPAEYEQTQTMEKSIKIKQPTT
jgi:hypothetical protein